MLLPSLNCSTLIPTPSKWACKKYAKNVTPPSGIHWITKNITMISEYGSQLFYNATREVHQLLGFCLLELHEWVVSRFFIKFVCVDTASGKKLKNLEWTATPSRLASYSYGLVWKSWYSSARSPCASSLFYNFITWYKCYIPDWCRYCDSILQR